MPGPQAPATIDRKYESRSYLLSLMLPAGSGRLKVRDFRSENQDIKLSL